MATPITLTPEQVQALRNKQGVNSGTPKTLTPQEVANLRNKQPGNTIEDQKKARIEQGLPISVRNDRAEPTKAGNFIRGIGKSIGLDKGLAALNQFAAGAQGLINAPSVIANPTEENKQKLSDIVNEGTQYDSKYFGRTTAPGTTETGQVPTVADWTKEATGLGLKASSVLPFGSAVQGFRAGTGLAAQGVPVLSNAVRSKLMPIALEGAAGGLLSSTGEELQKSGETQGQDKVEYGKILTDTLLGGAGGAAFGGLGQVGGKIISKASDLIAESPTGRKVVSSVAEKAKNMFGEKVGTRIANIADGEAKYDNLVKENPEVVKEVEDGAVDFMLNSFKGDYDQIFGYMPEDRLRLDSSIRRFTRDYLPSLTTKSEGKKIDITQAMGNIRDDISVMNEIGNHAIKGLGNVKTDYSLYQTLDAVVSDVLRSPEYKNVGKMADAKNSIMKDIQNIVAETKQGSKGRVNLPTLVKTIRSLANEEFALRRIGEKTTEQDTKINVLYQLRKVLQEDVYDMIGKNKGPEALALYKANNQRMSELMDTKLMLENISKNPEVVGQFVQHMASLMAGALSNNYLFYFLARFLTKEGAGNLSSYKFLSEVNNPILEALGREDKKAVLEQLKSIPGLTEKLQKAKRVNLTENIKKTRTKLSDIINQKK